MIKLIKINSWSINSKLLIFFLTLAILPLTLVGLISFYIAFVDVESKISDYSRNTINLMSMNISNFVGNYNNKINDIAFSPELQQDYLQTHDLDENDPNQLMILINLRNKIESYFAWNQYNNRNISNIAFFPRRDDKILSSGVELPIDNFKENRVFQSMSKRHGETLWVGESDLFKRTMNTTNITIIRNVVNRNYNYIEGVLVVTLYDKELEKIYSGSITKGGFLYITDSEGKIISTKDKNLMGSEIDSSLITLLEKVKSVDGELVVKQKVKGDQMQVALSKIADTEWFIVNVIPYSFLMQGTIKTLLVIILTMIAFIIVSIIISVMLTKTISDPIKNLQKKMKEVEDGNINTVIYNHYHAEFGDLARGFNNMLKQIGELMSSEKKANMEKAQAQFQALQVQINPHFLYNTLDTVNWMANIINADNIALVVTSLAKILRFSLDDGPKMTHVRYEIENLHNYIKIQQKRYNNLLNISIDLDEEIMDCQIIKFLFQPLLENSMYHAFVKIDNTCKIDIVGKLDGENIIFSIKDNGIGMDEETAKRCLKRNDSSERSGYALWNIAQRIELCYGERGLFKIESKPGFGTLVIIKIPTENGGTMQ